MFRISNKISQTYNIREMNDAIYLSIAVGNNSTSSRNDIRQDETLRL